MSRCCSSGSSMGVMSSTPVVEIAATPVGAADEGLCFAVVMEVENAIVFQEATENADDANVVAVARECPGRRPTVAAYDQVDLYACLRGAIQFPNHTYVVDGVHFSDDTTVSVFFVLGNFLFE